MLDFLPGWFLGTFGNFPMIEADTMCYLFYELIWGKVGTLPVIKAILQS